MLKRVLALSVALAATAPASAQPQPPGGFIACPGDPRCPRPSGTTRPEAPLPPPPVQPPPPAPAYLSPALPIIYFGLNSAALSAEARASLDQFVATLIREPSLRVLLSGHHDRSGTLAHARSLGLRRAESVRDHLIVRGVAASRIEVTSLGETQPRVTTADGVREPLNRRVEISLLP
jgi:OmpA-OmpF porin, OOP family